MKVVIDTNVMLRGLAKPSSYSGQLLHACDARTIPILLSKPVLDEYRAVLTDHRVMDRHPTITKSTVALLLRRLQYVSDYFRQVGIKFAFTRDPRDEKFIELAIAGQATHVISWDNDLLSLPDGRTDDSKRFRQRLPTISVVTPEEFVKGNAELLKD